MGKWHLSLEELPTSYTLDLSDLCSKFGFEDGEQFSDLCYTLEDVGEGKVDREAFIKAVVCKWALPSVGNPAVYEVGGIHNPIRHDTGSDLSSRGRDRNIHGRLIEPGSHHDHSAREFVAP
jgi:hypothetical protein